MAKKKNNWMPKKVAGIKIPKRLRKSRMLRQLLSSSLGRDILANALTAGAGAAAAVLINHREEVAEAAKKGERKAIRAADLASDAISGASSAVMGVVTDAAKSLLPEGTLSKKEARREASQEALKH
jgi:hypothetical protein